ncbi:MAG: nucleotide exchange factor GrpE [Ktedonobacterales bacterium]
MTERDSEEQVNGRPETAHEPATDGAATSAMPADLVGAQAQIAELTAQLTAARAEATQNWDKFLRERAEMDNFRKRQERIVSDRVRREKRELLGKVLEVVDNLDRALRYEDTLDREGLQQGLRMLQWQLNELLKNEGLAPVPTVGEQFDPFVHEAIELVASADHPEGVVVEEVRKGYRLGDETLRPARVKVSAGADGETGAANSSSISNS